MIAAIARKEIRGLVRDGRLWALGGAVLLLFLVMLGTTSQRREQAERERREVEAASRAQWDHQGDRNPHRAAHFGLYAFKPRSALAAVEPGVDDQAGQALWLEPHKRNMAMLAPAADAPPSLGLDELTPAFVLQALVPLLILVMGHAAVTKEREDGTLRMLHACGLRGVPLLLGKWLGLCGGAALVVVPALLAGAAWAVEGEGAAASAVFLAALLLYHATWAAIAVLVSVHARSSRAALLVLGAFWLAAVFVVPRLAASAVEHHLPLSTGEAFRAAIHHDIEHGLPGDGSAQQRLKDFEARLLAEHGVSRLADLPFGANAKRRLFRDAYATRVHALHFERLWEAQLRQQALLRWAAAISPFMPMRSLGSSLAGTDLAHRRHFEEAAEAYRQRFTTLVDEWDLQATRGVTSFESRYAGNAQWQAIPSWSYAPPPLAEALRTSTPELALLALWFSAALGGLCLSARKLTP
jgi:ABC-2 type transport system permease protein